MPEVFVNYRTGDGEKTAMAIERELSRRFGEEHVFRASKSIRPGETFDESLLANLRRSSVVLVVIGPQWLTAPARGNPDRRALDNRNDWVRREIQEAFACGLPIIPVLDGRSLERLDRRQLPPALARLADLQSIRLDTQRGSADLLHIGDELAARVPRLAELDRDHVDESGTTDTARVANSMAGSQSQGVQAGGDIHGNVGNTTIHSPSGPVHAGNGDLNHRSTRIQGDGTTYFEGGNSGSIGHDFRRGSGKPASDGDET